MAKTPTAKPTTINLAMKPRDKSSSCPDVTRCQLEVVWDDGHGAMFVKDGPNDSKLVQIGMIGEKGCNTKVRIGMIEIGGPIAVGATPIAGPEGIVLQRWERRLQDCIDPQELFLDGLPVSLLCSRYRLDAETVSLIVFCTSEGSWSVVLDRRGGLQPKPLICHYAAANDGLIVSAAISRDLQNLYIVESRSGVEGTTGTAYHYAYNRYTGEWTRPGALVIPQPAEIISHRAYYVDRDGLVSGYWASAATVSTEIDNVPEGLWCNNSPEGYDIRTTITDYTDIFGGGYSIPERRYVAGNTRRAGSAIWNGKIQPVEELFTPGAHHLRSVSSYAWTTDETGWHKTRAESYSFDSSQGFAAMIGGAELARTNDTGLYHLFSAASDYLVTVIDGTNCEMDINISFGGWTYVDGSKTITVTAGGWVLLHTFSRELNPTSMAPITDYSGPFTCINATFPCPGMIGWFEANRTSEESVDRHEVIYPKNLGSYHSISRSFTACDEESGTSYYGAYVQTTPESDPVWMVYKDGSEISPALTACLGRPLAELAAIYWRA